MAKIMYIYGLFGSLLAKTWLCSGLLLDHCQNATMQHVGHMRNVGKTKVRNKNQLWPTLGTVLLYLVGLHATMFT